jgi:hypothetical protein
MLDATLERELARERDQERVVEELGRALGSAREPADAAPGAYPIRGNLAAAAGVTRKNG